MNRRRVQLEHSRRRRACSAAGGPGPPGGRAIEQPRTGGWSAPDCEDSELDTRCAGAQARGAPRAQHGQAHRPRGDLTLPQYITPFGSRPALPASRPARLPPSPAPKLPPNSREPSACPPQFKTDGSVLALLKLLDSAKRPRVLELVDAGQRARRAAECYTVG